MKAKALKPNSKIALIAPAGAINEQKLLKAQETLEKMGFRVSFTKRILYQNSYLAGSDNERLSDLHEAFEDSTNDAILCIRGGYGAARIVDKIDYSLIKNNPKIFIGYSDITALLNSIWQKTSLVCFHGVLGTSSFTDYTKLQFLNIFTNNLPNNEILTQDKNQISIIKNGKASGELVGGNLSIVNSLIGTDYEIDFTDKIAFFEDIGEDFYKIDRMITQLLLTKTFRKSAGIILGTFNKCMNYEGGDSYTNSELTLNDIFTERFKDLDIPIINGFSFGHVDEQAIFPIGIKAQLDTKKAFSIKLLEKPLVDF